MLLIDTSVWISFFQQPESEAADFLENALNTNQFVCINGIIEMEILQGVKDEEAFNSLRLYLEDFQYFPELSKRHFDKAVEIYRTCRKKGVTVRKSLDCLIAANCLLDNLEVVHRDRDFAMIKKVYRDLKTIEVR